ncbi:MAG: hypothetical protein KDA41_18630 [Planctomycetales bacterium]|nr:hypothetical protein [Planctomycetales bacterium]
MQCAFCRRTDEPRVETLRVEVSGVSTPSRLVYEIDYCFHRSACREAAERMADALRQVHGAAANESTTAEGAKSAEDQMP